MERCKTPKGHEKQLQQGRATPEQHHIICKQDQCSAGKGRKQGTPDTHSRGGKLSQVSRCTVQEKAKEQWADRITLPDTPVHQEGRTLLTSSAYQCLSNV